MTIKKIVAVVFAVLFMAAGANAQTQTTEAENSTDALPTERVCNLTLKDLNGNIMDLPYFGEKNLFIFYIDPDTGIRFRHPNYTFSDVIEETGVSQGPNLFGFGILNMADTFLPRGLIRTVARRRVANNGGLVLEDPDNSLSKAWGLGDCNGKYMFMIITKEGEIVFLQKERITEEEKVKFFEIAAKYK